MDIAAEIEEARTVTEELFKDAPNSALLLDRMLDALEAGLTENKTLLDRWNSALAENDHLAAALQESQHEDQVSKEQAGELRERVETLTEAIHAVLDDARVNNHWHPAHTRAAEATAAAAVSSRGEAK